MVQFCYLRLHLGIEIVSCCLFATNTKDGHGLKLKTLGQLFQVLMVRLQKLPKQIIMIRAPR